MIDFSAENGATRFIRGTHRSRHPIPSLEDEPAYMQHSIACAPARSALIRDVRCWHGGTANTSEDVRIMTSVGYYAPCFVGPKAMEKCRVFCTMIFQNAGRRCAVILLRWTDF